MKMITANQVQAIAVDLTRLRAAYLVQAIAAYLHVARAIAAFHVRAIVHIADAGL